jgi:alpha-glucosidase
MPDLLWWQRGIIYQIYPRSFQDSTGDGVGDIAGILSRLDYLEALGIDAVWLSPIFPSPMADCGYDISDYIGIDPLFGTLDDFDSLLASLHRRNLRLILDFVPNHTSNRHPWFIESASSRENEKRDWYIWHDPAPDGGPPNNWLGEFGGSAWTLDAKTGQYYYHAFLAEQPDLNWRNPAVRAAMYDVLRFWLDRGVDGFRVDVLWHLIKDDQFRDNPVNPRYQPGSPPNQRVLPLYDADRPEVHGIVAEMRAVLDRYQERVLIGEIYLPVERLVTYYGAGLDGAQLPFNFQLILAAWNARTIAALIDSYEAALPPGGWPNWVLGNHDQRRVASRIGQAQARIAAMLLLTLRGTPTLYYGDELGMESIAIPLSQVRDRFEQNVPGLGLGRDPARTPMQWDESEKAGFTVGQPWLPLSPDHAKRNVAALTRDSDSILSLYRRLIHLRRQRAALSVGAYRALPATGDILGYWRGEGAERLLIILNFGSKPCRLTLPESAAWRILLSTSHGRSGERIAADLAVQADEGLILEPA